MELVLSGVIIQVFPHHLNRTLKQPEPPKSSFVLIVLVIELRLENAHCRDKLPASRCVYDGLTMLLVA